MTKSKILVILGQTATGKSDLAVTLAKKFYGEIISCDSRQVYKGLNIGTGKITKKEMRGVPHYMLDIVSPKKVYTASLFQKEGKRKIEDIIKRGMIPVIVGGSGFYINILIDDIFLPNVPPNKKLREELEKLTNSALMNKLKKIDQERASSIDKKNKRRIIRAIEIGSVLGYVPKINMRSPYNTLFIGLKLPQDILKKNIKKRLENRLKKGMVVEARKLHKKGLSYKKMEELGLEYRYIAHHLKGNMNKEKMIEVLEKEIFRYAKRQFTWFKKNKRIKWFLPTEIKKVEHEVLKFLKN